MIKKYWCWGLAGLIGVAALLFYYVFLITHGDFHMVADEFTGMTYASMWSHLLHGQFDIDPAVNPELFFRDGKYYVYYSFFAVLVRGLMSIFYNPTVSIPRITLLLAALELAVANLAIGFQLGLHKGKIRKIFFIFAGVLLFASPYIYILSPAHCYHEAIMWGVANLTLFNFLFLRFAMDPKKNTVRKLCIMGVVAGFAMLSRPNTGFPTFLVLGFTGLILFIRYLKPLATGFLSKVPRLSMAKLLLVALVWIFCGSGYLFVNYERMGSPFAVTPVLWHWQFSNPPGVFNPRGYAYYKYGEWRLDRYPFGFEYYMVPHADNFQKNWPWLNIGYTTHLRAFSKHIDYIEPGTYMPVTLTAPLILILALVGFYFLGEKWKKDGPTRQGLITILVAGNFWVWFFNFGFSDFNLRYTVDLIPAAVLTGYIGLYALKPLVENWTFSKRVVITTLVALGGFVSLWTSGSTYIGYVSTNPHISLNDRKAFFYTYVAPLIRKISK